MARVLEKKDIWAECPRVLNREVADGTSADLLLEGEHLLLQSGQLLNTAPDLNTGCTEEYFAGERA